MEWSIMFVFNSVLLGVGLAMDAFSVSMANGLNEPKMKHCFVQGLTLPKEPRRDRLDSFAPFCRFHRA